MDAVLAALSDGATAVTANNRLARSISLAFNRQQRAAGRLAWRTPRVVPWQAWLAQLWSLSLVARGEAGRRALLTDFQCRLVWTDVVRTADPGQLPGAVGPLADAASRAWRLCLDWRVSLADVAAGADSDDTRTFASWAGLYRDRCESEGLADAAMIVPLLAADLQRGVIKVPDCIHFVGFDNWTPLQRELLRVLSTLGHAVHEEPPPAPGRTDACRVSCHDANEELDRAARWARKQLQANPGRTVGIVVPDLASRSGAVRRTILDVFAPDWRLSPGEELPVNFSYAGSLARTGMVHAALLFLRGLTGQLDYRDSGQLLRTPFLAGSRAEAGARARLDLELRSEFGLRVDLVRLAERAEKAAPLISARLGRLAGVATRMPVRQGTAGWADTFRQALDAVGWPGDDPLASDQHQTGLACQRLWDDLRSCHRFAGSMTLERALALIEGLARDQVFQPAGHPDAVQVLGTLEAVGQTFDALWICGLTSEAWPPGGRPNPLLPLGLQRQLRMPDSSPALTRQRSERLLRWLEASAPTVVVSWPEFAGDEPLFPSPLLGHLAQRSWEDLEAWHGPGRAEALAAVTTTEQVNVDPPPPVDPAIRLRGGAALLEREAKCPARAFLEFRLGARELEVPSPGIDASTRGSIMHAVLDQFFRRVRSHGQLCRLSQGEQYAALNEFIDMEIARKLSLGDPVVAAIARNEKQRLHGLLGVFLDGERQRQGFVVRWTEEMPAIRSAPPALSSLEITLRPDRIDVMPDGKALIIDYKTGGSLPSLKELCGPRPRSPQLPLYATLADADGVAFIHLGSGGVRWAGIGPASWAIKGIVEPAKLTRSEQADWAAMRSSWWSALDRLAAEILTGEFSIDRWRRDEASGQWAMATRVHELPDEEEVEA